MIRLRLRTFRSHDDTREPRQLRKMEILALTEHLYHSLLHRYTFRCIGVGEHIIDIVQSTRGEGGKHRIEAMVFAHGTVGENEVKVSVAQMLDKLLGVTYNELHTRVMVQV